MYCACHVRRRNYAVMTSYDDGSDLRMTTLPSSGIWICVTTAAFDTVYLAGRGLSHPCGRSRIRDPTNARPLSVPFIVALVRLFRRSFDQRIPPRPLAYVFVIVLSLFFFWGAGVGRTGEGSEEIISKPNELIDFKGWLKWNIFRINTIKLPTIDRLD